MTDHTDVEIVDNAVGLLLRRVVVGALATNCWIIIDARDQRAIIVDPGDEPHRILDACTDLDVRAIALTHTHWDHVLALPDIADALGVDVLAHPDDRPVWAHECQHLHRHGHFDAGTATDALLADDVHLRPPPDRALWDGQTTDIRHRNTIPVGNDTALTVLHATLARKNSPPPAKSWGAGDDGLACFWNGRFFHSHRSQSRDFGRHGHLPRAAGSACWRPSLA